MCSYAGLETVLRFRHFRLDFVHFGLRPKLIRLYVPYFANFGISITSIK